MLPTGAGKTFTAVHWIIKNYVDQGIKVLWIAYRSELLRQAAEAFYKDTTVETLQNRSEYISFVISSEFGRSCNIKDDDVVIASRQSICSGTNMENFVKWVKGRKLKPRRKVLIVLDEAHHAAAKSYRTIIKTISKYVPHVDVLGLTATPFRTAKNEQGSLKKIFSTGTGIVYSIDMNTLIREGILSKPIYTEMQTDIDMTKIFDSAELKKITRNDLTSLGEKGMKKLQENTNRNKVIVDTYLKNREKYGQTIVFAVDVINAIALNAIFRSHGVRSDFVVSSIVSGLNRSASSERNPKIINEFKNGTVEVLVNVNIVTEGTDIPNIQTVFLARPTTSKILMTQMIGRGLRGEAAGGTKETQIVYFIDEWKGMVDFVSPTELLDGEDHMPLQSSERKKTLLKYIKLAEVESYALGLYEKTASITVNCNNIIPYGIIRCAYLNVNDLGEETEFSRDILVFDEAADIYKKILMDIAELYNDEKISWDNTDIRILSSELFFKYCENREGTYIGVSSENIKDILLASMFQGEVPILQLVDDRVSLFEIAQELYEDGLYENTLEETLKTIWNNNSKIRSWYDYDFYRGMMHVYLNRWKSHEFSAPKFLLPPKEEMDMGEIKKHYPAYYHELREYLLQKTKRDEDGYYYSAIQEEGKPPFRSKYLMMFEMDHIIPISRGGKTVKENLQLILRSQNIKKGAKVD